RPDAAQERRIVVTLWISHGGGGAQPPRSGDADHGPSDPGQRLMNMMNRGLLARGHGLVLPSTYDPHLVALSVVVASIAAYTALTLAERVTVAHGRLRLLWLLGGATAMGSGIWSMHFTGMLAFTLPIPVSYALPPVALSLLVAI